MFSFIYKNVAIVLNVQLAVASTFNSMCPSLDNVMLKTASLVSPMSVVVVSLKFINVSFQTQAIIPALAFVSSNMV